jgi:hypothetical protein
VLEANITERYGSGSVAESKFGLCKNAETCYIGGSVWSNAASCPGKVNMDPCVCRLPEGGSVSECVQ